MKIRNQRTFASDFAAAAVTFGGTACALTALFNSTSGSNGLLIVGLLANVGVMAWFGARTIGGVEWRSHSRPRATL